MAIAPSNTAGHHPLLLINPHTSFFFRSESQMCERRRVGRLWPVTGVSSSSTKDSTTERGDAHVRAESTPSASISKTVEKKEVGSIQVWKRRAPLEVEEIIVPYKIGQGWGKKVQGISHHHEAIVREADGKWVSIRFDARACEGLDAVLHAHEGEG